MNKKEIAEIKKQYTQERCPATRICGCYVDAEKKIKAEFAENFLTLSEEEFFKYLNIFRKTLSGTMGKNLLNIEFPLEAEAKDGAQERLMKLKYSGLKDDALLEEFYDKVIDSYCYTGNYLILLLYGNYDIPGKASDGHELFDASEEVYEHLFCCVCPVNLAKPCLSFDEREARFTSRMRDWIVGMPLIGFLFPAFHDRSADIHSLLYYNQKPETPGSDFVENVLGCGMPLTAGNQKETFQMLVEETFGEECSFETVRTLHETLNEMLEEQAETSEEVLTLDCQGMKRLLEQSGAENESLSGFDERFDRTAGEGACLVASNVANTRKFEVKTPDVLIQVNPARTDLVEKKVIDGRNCLVIRLEDGVQVNGILVK